MTQGDGDGAQWDRGALIREWLLRLLHDQPFSPSVIRLEGGFELSVLTPETVIVEPRVLVVTIYEGDEQHSIVPVERIVSLRVLK